MLRPSMTVRSASLRRATDTADGGDPPLQGYPIETAACPPLAHAWAPFSRLRPTLPAGVRPTNDIVPLLRRTRRGSGRRSQNRLGSRRLVGESVRPYVRRSTSTTPLIGMRGRASRSGHISVEGIGTATGLAPAPIQTGASWCSSACRLSPPRWGLSAVGVTACAQLSSTTPDGTTPPRVLWP